MNTNEDREFARIHAQRIQSHHDEIGTPDTVISTKLSGYEIHRRGFLGECAFVHEFGGEIDTELRSNGDGGRDFFLTLALKPGDLSRVRRFQVDVKIAGYIRKDTRLLVRVDKIKKEVIYIGAAYNEYRDEVDLRCWEFGASLIQWNEIRVLNERNVPNYTKAWNECRSLDELRIRQVIKNPFHGICSCGLPGLYAVKEGDEWKWFCNKHRQI